MISSHLLCTLQATELAAHCQNRFQKNSWSLKMVTQDGHSRQFSRITIRRRKIKGLCSEWRKLTGKARNFNGGAKKKNTINSGAAPDKLFSIHDTNLVLCLFCHFLSYVFFTDIKDEKTKIVIVRSSPAYHMDG